MKLIINLIITRDSSLKLWKNDGTCRRTYKGHTGAVTGLSLSQSKFAASSSTDSTVRIWDVGSGRNLYTLQGHIGAVNNVMW